MDEIRFALWFLEHLLPLCGLIFTVIWGYFLYRCFWDDIQSENQRGITKAHRQFGAFLNFCIEFPLCILNFLVFCGCIYWLFH